MAGVRLCYIIYMPKLPQQNKESSLEVLDKKVYSTGELTFPKIPKHRIVFKHHMKLALILLAVAVVLGLVYMAAKPMFNNKVKDEVALNDLDKSKNKDELTAGFVNHTDQDFESVKAENKIVLIVDKVDLESGIIEGEDLDNPGKRFKIRVVEKSKIYWVSAPDEQGNGGGIKTDLSLNDIKNGGAFDMFVIEDPGQATNLTLISGRRIG